MGFLGIFFGDFPDGIFDFRNSLYLIYTITYSKFVKPDRSTFAPYQAQEASTKTVRSERHTNN